MVLVVHGNFLNTSATELSALHLETPLPSSRLSSKTPVSSSTWLSAEQGFDGMGLAETSLCGRRERKVTRRSAAGGQRCARKPQDVSTKPALVDLQ